ncbi:MAG: TetM/TetW/TetO/TetS family tetracycline resistance ribosomal protection protein [Lachnospiraceae bacterium]|nr:TetM/TetW/TetO/TetS family tetracycline resistance ribosomal protection protein [Lachnospiraceae bacterium]MDY4792569.1 translation factor GTPase family protein [Pararoseburia sp.]
MIQNKKITLGILAHVDAGKTTLSEALLYETGAIRSRGRVDHGDTLLDNDEMERQRGITIFSKAARMNYKEKEFILLDTPGHADFTAEMERVLSVLDYGIIVISGTDGVQGHTRTLWKLLEKYGVPCFLFVNKMDIGFVDKSDLLEDLRGKLSDSCVDFSDFSGANANPTEDEKEAVALCDEKMLTHYLETGEIKQETLRTAIAKRKVFPVLFGSALKMDGVEELLESMDLWMTSKAYPEEFGARCYKVGRDIRGERLTYLKITGGTLRVKDVIGGNKINQIRLYLGDKYETVDQVSAGEICGVTGIQESYPGMGLGSCPDLSVDVIEPVLSYQVIPPEGCAPHVLLGYMRQLEEEDPTLKVIWQEGSRQVHVHLMGPVQTEIIQQQIKKRFGVLVTFGPGAVRYKETIEGAVEGVGHFEPLRHYAEAHILIEELPRGSGVECGMDCPTDVLDLNWQRLICTHLAEKTHRGVLTGSPLTDVRLTVVTGKAHKKHTEGGDFRQATYRAVRQGLRKAKNVLLEPYYFVRLEVPAELIGRAMTDMSQMHGEFDAPVTEGETAVLTGKAPVSLLREYGTTLASYSGGRGQMSVSLAGYFPCHNPEEVIEEIGYDPDRDVKNTCDSVFCGHGAGYTVPWYEVEDKMHMPFASYLYEKEQEPDEAEMIALAKARALANRQGEPKKYDGYGGLESDLEEIFVREFGEIKRRLPSQEIQVTDFDRERRIQEAREEYRSNHTTPEKKKNIKKYFLVDGYNIIFSWDELNEIAKSNLDGARGRLLDIMCNFQGHIDQELIVVFDAYRIKGHTREVVEYHNIHVVYTKEAETADAYIERISHEMAKEHQVTVATSDRLEQMIVIGNGARRISARELEAEVKRVNEEALKRYEDKKMTSTTEV